MILIGAYYLGLTMAALVCSVVPQLADIVTRSGNLSFKCESLPLWISQNRLISWIFTPIPKKWFGHFYILGIIVQSVILYRIEYSTVSILYLGHLIRRAVESNLIERHSNSTMLFGHYLIGTSFYIVTPVSINLDYIAPLSFLKYLGYFLFVLAQAFQAHAHWTLVQLRSGPQCSSDYKLPQTGLFQYVASPHYTAEMLIYFSIMLMNPSSSSFCCLLWVVVNLSIMAAHSHQWYSERFKEHKKFLHKRSILIPWIY
jgi:3-oxo-5-alpha-steroid 4-dehydrogenase 3 / polyprenol reductase